MPITEQTVAVIGSQSRLVQPCQIIKLWTSLPHCRSIVVAEPSTQALEKQHSEFFIPRQNNKTRAAVAQLIGNAGFNPDMD